MALDRYKGLAQMLAITAALGGAAEVNGQDEGVSGFFTQEQVEMVVGEEGSVLEEESENAEVNVQDEGVSGFFTQEQVDRVLEVGSDLGQEDELSSARDQDSAEITGNFFTREQINRVVGERGSVLAEESEAVEADEFGFAEVFNEGEGIIDELEILESQDVIVGTTDNQVCSDLYQADDSERQVESDQIEEDFELESEDHETLEEEVGDLGITWREILEQGEDGDSEVELDSNEITADQADNIQVEILSESEESVAVEEAELVEPTVEEPVFEEFPEEEVLLARYVERREVPSSRIFRIYERECERYPDFFTSERFLDIIEVDFEGEFRTGFSRLFRNNSLYKQLKEIFAYNLGRDNSEQLASAIILLMRSESRFMEDFGGEEAISNPAGYFTHIEVRNGNIYFMQEGSNLFSVSLRDLAGIQFSTKILTRD